MLRGVIIGCGAMGRCHGERYQGLPNATITAVMDTDSQKCQKLADELGCRWVRCLEEIDDEPIDFADICLPTHLHLSMIRRVSLLTRNIICEKPIAVRPEEVREAEELVASHGVHLMVAQVVRFWDTYAKAWELMQSSLGKITSVSLTRRQERPSWASDSWLTNTSLSGGLVFDLMIHDIDWIVWHAGMPASVYGDIVSAEDGEPVHAKALLRYPDFTVDLFSSWGMPENYGLDSTLEVIGTRGKLICDRKGELTLVNAEGSMEIAVRRYDAYREELAYFLECCESNQEPEKSSLSSVLPSVRTAWMIHKSAMKKEAVLLTQLENV